MKCIEKENIQLVKQNKQNSSPPPKMKQLFILFTKTMRNLSTLLAINFQRPPPFYFTISPLAKLTIITIAVGIIEFKSSMGS